MDRMIHDCRFHCKCCGPSPSKALVQCGVFGFKEDSKLPKPNRYIDLGGSEGENNCSKWNVVQSVQDIFVSFKNIWGVQCHRVVFED